ncbi:MAG: DUF362 domain-containing protein [Planctomycetia bacterium]|nr:DUF362 domain-containing protein [Planctomycetia bacterium]
MTPASFSSEINEKQNLPIVYFTRKITPEKLVEIYLILDRKLPGKVAVKVHSGEPGGHHFIQPKFMKSLVDLLQGTIVECNTAYEGRRDTTEKHNKVMEEHGFTKIAPVDIMDADGELELPVSNGKQLKTNYVGSHLQDYDSMLVLSHFKGHLMGGFGGALKNMSIGIASAHGKALIHGAGDPNVFWDCDQDKFLEAMADADKSIMDYLEDRLAFINIMKDLSVDCDCDANPHAPEMDDIGILASLDPVALDQACVDLIYRSDDKGKNSLIKRMEDKHAVHILEAAEELGIGKRQYILKEIE